MNWLSWVIRYFWDFLTLGRLNFLGRLLGLGSLLTLGMLNPYLVYSKAKDDMIVAIAKPPRAVTLGVFLV
ncbi:hypothetical protein GCM10010377_83120 [Streptomyces viridiviolaceus]|nr:hypothetical protein GCM10010377_83120 [Streptomyces viridiviolaceus]